MSETARIPSRRVVRNTNDGTTVADFAPRARTAMSDWAALGDMVSEQLDDARERARLLALRRNAPSPSRHGGGSAPSIGMGHARTYGR